MILAQSNFLKLIGSCAKSWDEPEATGNAVAEWAETGYRRDGAREERKGANIKQEARRGRGMPWTTRERGSGLVGNRRRTPYSFGGSLILFAYPRTVRNRRDLSANLSLSRGFPRHPIIGRQLHFCKINPRCTYEKRFYHVGILKLWSFKHRSNEKSDDATDFFFLVRKKVNKIGPFVPVLLHQIVITMVRK